MKVSDWDIEAMAEILSEHGLPTDKAEDIARDFVGHMDAMGDISMNAHIGGKPHCDECKAKDRQIAQLEADLVAAGKVSQWRLDVSRSRLSTLQDIHANPDDADRILRKHGFD